jgi:predicted transglutaminase-like cysteine proteinase
VAGIESDAFTQADARGGEIAIAAQADTEREQVAVLAGPVQVRAADQAEGRVAEPSDEGQAPVTVTALDPVEPQISPPALPEPFGLSAMPVAGGDVFSKWTKVEGKIRGEREILVSCRENAEHCSRPALSFLAAIDTGRGLSGRRRVGAINRAINMAIAPMSDVAQWGVADHWSTPLETFGTGRGDCEDYAIAKYVALTEAGINAQDVKLVIVRNVAANEDHAAAAVRLDGGWIILDNRWLALVEDVAMPRAVPLFVLDSAGVRKFEPAAVAVAHRATVPASL